MVRDTESVPQQCQADAPTPRFLPDQPCLRADRIRFGHEVYVAVLQDVVAECPTPFVIGLYGKWGTGKTTVLEGLRAAFVKGASNGRGFKVCLFDAWKYSEETSFRRQFLAELNKQLGLGWDVDSLLYRPKEEQKFDVSALHRNLWTGICAGVAVVLGLALASWVLQYLVGAQLAGVLVAAAAGGVLTILMFVVGIVFDVIKMSTYRVTHPLIFAPEQFEEQFLGMLSKAGITDERRLLVLVDNLDRCAPDAAVSALKTIKTFLEHKGCIFVVACDEDALIRHLMGDTGSRDNATVEGEAKEFLRKFFQTTMEIEPLSDDLRDFASELVEQAGLHPDVATVVWAASPRDPRRILQFLNRLILALHVVKARETSGRLPAGVISGDQPYLAKVLWLNEICEDFVSDCARHRELISLADETIKYPDATYADPRWMTYLSAGARQGAYQTLHRFLEATIHVTVDDPEPFFSMQMPALDIGIDDASIFRDMLRQGLTQDIGTLISNVTDPSKRSRYRDIMARTIQRELDSGRRLEALQASRVAAQCFDLLPEPRRLLANAVCHVLRGAVPEKDIPAFDQAGLVKCISEASSPLGNRATEVAVESLDHRSPHTGALFEAIQEHSSLLDAAGWGGVGKFLSATLSAAPDTGLRYLNAIDPESQAATVPFEKGPKILAQLAAIAVSAEAGIAERAMQAFARLRKHADSGAMNQLCTGATSLLSAPPESRAEGCVARAATALSYLDLDKTSGELVRALHNSVRAAIGEPRPPEEIAQLLPHLLRLYAPDSEPEQQETIRLITGFARSWPPDKLTLLGDAIWHAEIEPVRAAFTQGVADRVPDPQRSSEEIGAVLAAVAGVSADTELSVLSVGLDRLLERPEMPMKVLGASQVAKYADRLPRTTLDRLVSTVHREYMAHPTPESEGLLVHLLVLVDTQRGRSMRNTLADRLKLEMTGGDPSVRRSAANSYRALQQGGKLSWSIRKTVAHDLADGLHTLRKELGVEDANLFEILLEEQDNPQVVRTTWRSVAHTLESLLHSDHLPELRRMACGFMCRFEKLPKAAADGVLEQLEMIASDSTLGEDLRNDASSAMASLRKRYD